MRGPPVVLTPTLGRPVTNVASLNGAVPMVVVNTLGEPVTLVAQGGEPVTLFNESGAFVLAISSRFGALIISRSGAQIVGR